MGSPRFTPLHVHSHYSLMEGVDGPEAMAARAAACGYPAIALTDRNNLYGAVPFLEAARKHGVRPILGVCLAHQGRRATVLIAEPNGYAGVCRILSRLHLQERPDLVELLCENPEGLQVLVDGTLQEDLTAENAEERGESSPRSLRSPRFECLDRLREAFGSRLWMEIIRPSPSAARERTLLEWAARHGVRPVASVAARFAVPEGYDLFRLLHAIRNGMLIDQVPGRLSITPAHHLAEPEEVYHRFRDLPEAVVNTAVLVEQCRSDVLPRGVVLPPVWTPKAHDAASYLTVLCERGLRRRIGDGDLYRDRLLQELHIINQRDLAGYFLVVRDIARQARRRGYSMALRGSAGNSLVCYLLQITEVDPLRFDLPLERFLHAGRPDLPDIDLDFDWKVRDGIIDWVFEKYGRAHTAMISTHQFLQPKSAFREAAKVHGMSNEQIANLLETLGERIGALLNPELQIANCKMQMANGMKAPKAFPLDPARWPMMLADARRLIGRPHHLSIHPGGVVITPRPIENYVPLQRAPKGIVITQFEKDAIEQVGLVKIDLLGNRALSTVDAARAFARRGVTATRRAQSA